MSAGDDAPPIAIVEWTVDGQTTRSRRAIELAARASRVITIGPTSTVDRSDSRVAASLLPPPDLARDLAAASESSDRGLSAVLFEGDPLDVPFAVDLGRWLTAYGCAWELVPARIDLAECPRAVAHLSRETLALGDDDWLAWRQRHSLLGRVIAVTRAESQAGELVSALDVLGADPIVCPTIEIVDPEDWGPLDAALRSVAAFDWIVLTSANGASRFFDRLEGLDVDAASVHGARIAAVGPATARSIAKRGFRADVVPSEYVAESLFSAIGAVAPLRGARVLIARAAVGRDLLPNALREAGASVEVVATHRTIRNERSRELLEVLVDGSRLDLVTFTSSSSVSNLVDLVGEARARRVRAACIGPVTSATARSAGMDVAVEAADYSIDGLVTAIEAWGCSQPSN